MPAQAADYFGTKHIGATYGLIFPFNGVSSVLGPVLVATARDATGAYTLGLHTLAIVLAHSLAIPFAIRPPRIKEWQLPEAGQLAPA
jgi:OFA family oxalate/formate antiporter-like MFS transporter